MKWEDDQKGEGVRWGQRPIPEEVLPTRPGIITTMVRKDRMALLGFILVFAVVLTALLAPFISLADPYDMKSELRLSPPGTNGFILGADELGRDILARLLWGARFSLFMGLAPVLGASLAGILLGLLAGYRGGWVDQVIGRVLDVMFSFPPLLIALAIAALLGPSMKNAVIALTIVLIPSFTRVMRGSVLAVKELAYVEAAKASGAKEHQILIDQILPNILSPLMVYSTLDAGRMIVIAAGLSFLGLGAQPPTPEWGLMLSEGRSVLTVAPHVATIPGFAIFVVVLGFNLIGDSLRDALDPRLKV